MTRLLEFLILKQNSKLSTFIKNRARAAAGAEIKKNALEKRADNPHIQYGLGHNTIFFRILGGTHHNFFPQLCNRTVFKNLIITVKM
jgi:hypothetical protein